MPLETFDVKAEELGAQEQQIWTAPFKDYTIAGSESQWIALIVGIAATLLLFVAGIGVAKLIRKKKGGQTMKVPQSLRDLVEGAESLVYVEDLSGKKGVMQAINPIAKLVAIIGMIIASLFITNLTYLLAICIVPLVLAVASRIPLKHFFLRTAVSHSVCGITLNTHTLHYSRAHLFGQQVSAALNLVITAEGITSSRCLHSPCMVLRRIPNHCWYSPLDLIKP